MQVDKQALWSELQFKAVRSSGPGGQHVNKVSSKVVLSWDLAQSRVLQEHQKQRLLEVWKNRLNKLGVLQLECDSARSQIKNKDLVVSRFFKLLTESLKTHKVRLDTKTPKRALVKRREQKEKVSLKKILRKRIDRSDF